MGFARVRVRAEVKRRARERCILIMKIRKVEG
jgi:hypothetical protein